MSWLISPDSIMPVAALQCPCLALWSSEIWCNGQGREWGWLLLSYTLIMTVFSKVIIFPCLHSLCGLAFWPTVHLTVGFIERWAAFMLSRTRDVSNKFVPSRSRFPTSRPRDSWISISGVQVCFWIVESGLPLQPAELVLQGPGIDEQMQMVRWTQQ